MRLTLAQLDAFYWVSQLGSVQLAARQLNLAQPTISLRIKELEQSLGRDLFERAGRGLRITDAGVDLLERAHVILAEVGKIREERTVEVSGTIRIGFAEGVAMVCLAPFLEALRQDYPALKAELYVATSSALERDMGAHRLDLAFLVNPVGQAGLRMLPLGAQPTVWTASPRWGLEGRVRPADLRSVPIISNPPPSAMYRQIVDWFSSAGLEPARLDLCTSVTVVAHLVASGVGVGLLPLKMIETQLQQGVLLVLSTQPQVEPGRLFATFWEAGQTSAVHAAIRTLKAVISRMDYLVSESSAG
jgi:DNA-binding transcriptional LysR family regulator